MRIQTTGLLAILLMLTAVNLRTRRAQSGMSSALTGSVNDGTESEFSKAQSRCLRGRWELGLEAGVRPYDCGSGKD